MRCGLKIEFKFTLRNFCIVQFVIVTTVITICAFAYLFTHITGHSSVLGFLPLLDVGKEQSIPTYVSVLNLLLASILLFLIFRHEKLNNKNRAGYWGFLSAIFFYLSIDEFASIHEKFGGIHERLVDTDIVPQTLNTHLWLPFGALFVVIVFFAVVPFLRGLPSDTRRNFLIAGGVFITGALGFEYIGALMLESGLVESKQHIAYLVRRLFEEGFEMYGVAIFNCALYREALYRNISLKFGE